jgi:epoxide hydrolase-like predicted phosphatase
MTSRSARPEGLLLDYGGVLTNPVGPALSSFCRSRGLADDAVAALRAPGCAFSSELEAYERGEYDDEQFMPAFAQALGVAPRDMDTLLAEIQPDERMFGAVAVLREHGVRTGVLSNSWGMTGYPLPRLGRAFDGVVISGAVGMRKPERRIYEHAARIIGIDPRRCVFVDDTEDNLPVAVETGMTAVHHRDCAETLRELERLFHVDLRGGDRASA